MASSSPLMAVCDWGRSRQEQYPDFDTLDHRHIEEMG